MNLLGRRLGWAVAVFWLLAAYPGWGAEVTLIISGSFRGRIEGCGCPSGLTGNLANRAALIAAKFPAGAPPGIDCGGILDLDFDMGRMNSRCAILGLSRLGLKVVGVVPRDLFYGVDYLRGLADSAGVALVSANLVDAGTNARLFPDWNVLEESGIRIAITSLAAYDSSRRQADVYGWRPLPPDSVLRSLSESHPVNVAAFVLLTDIGETELRSLIQSSDLFDLVLSSSWQFQSSEPFNVNGTLMAHPDNDGRTLQWVTIDGTASRGQRCKIYSVPVTTKSATDKQVLQWLQGCLGREVK